MHIATRAASYRKRRARGAEGGIGKGERGRGRGGNGGRPHPEANSLELPTWISYHRNLCALHHEIHALGGWPSSCKNPPVSAAASEAAYPVSITVLLFTIQHQRLLFVLTSLSEFIVFCRLACQVCVCVNGILYSAKVSAFLLLILERPSSHSSYTQTGARCLKHFDERQHMCSFLCHWLTADSFWQNSLSARKRMSSDQCTFEN